MATPIGIAKSDDHRFSNACCFDKETRRWFDSDPLELTLDVLTAEVKPTNNR
jgi:hypothetical protein